MLDFDMSMRYTAIMAFKLNVVANWVRSRKKMHLV